MESIGAILVLALGVVGVFFIDNYIFKRFFWLGSFFATIGYLVIGMGIYFYHQMKGTVFTVLRGQNEFAFLLEAWPAIASVVVIGLTWLTVRVFFSIFFLKRNQLTKGVCRE